MQLPIFHPHSLIAGEAQALRALDDHNRHVPLLNGLLIHCAAGHGRLVNRHVLRSANDRYNIEINFVLQ